MHFSSLARLGLSVTVPCRLIEQKGLRLPSPSLSWRREPSAERTLAPEQTARKNTQERIIDPGEVRRRAKGRGWGLPRGRPRRRDGRGWRGSARRSTCGVG